MSKGKFKLIRNFILCILLRLQCVIQNIYFIQFYTIVATPVRLKNIYLQQLHSSLSSDS